MCWSPGSAWRGGGDWREGTSISDLPDLTLASQVGSFGEYMLSCHNGYGNQADVREGVGALDGPFDISGSRTPGDLDYQVDFYPVFRTPATYHEIYLIELLGLGI